MTKTPTNIGASVRAKLLKLSKERREDYQLLLARYANERLLHRLSVSPYASAFVLKGAALFTLWTGRAHRATRDIDLLGFGEPTEARLPTVVAEKLEAMVKLGIANSRMKDFYDVVIMSRTFAFDGDELVRAIRATFERRGTALPEGLPLALTDEFAADATKRAQWAGFVRKAGASTELREFDEVVREARGFLAEPLAACRASEPWAFAWPAPGPWRRP